VAVSNRAEVVVIVAALAGLASMAVIVAYAIQNESGHTGFSPYLGLAVFIPASAVGLFHIYFFPGSGAARHWAVIALAAGLTGVCLLVYLDLSGTLLEYGVWCDRGMP
jgi:hypothetical protein